MLNNKGQNLLEYVLFVAAVLLVCIYFFANMGNSPMGQSVNSTLYSMVNLINSTNEADSVIMTMKKQLTLGQKNLVRRYLIWAYKSTKESFERIERKTTQLIVDEFILDHLSKNKLDVPGAFKAYIAQKHKEELKLKFTGADKKKLHPEYLYLKNRLAAIEVAIKYFLGNKELGRIAGLYEEEFTRRILEARDH